MSGHTYEDLIAEAFIKPIRSVLIVDDDYPTLHDMLLDPSEREKSFKAKEWAKSSENREKVRKVIEEFRQPEAPYLLDIHDGSSPNVEKDQKQVDKLQQTDLLILDYQLDKTKLGDGTAAIEMARKALSNKHFNLILVHTQEKLEDIFFKFVVGLMEPIFKSVGDPDDEVEAFIAEHEDAMLGSIGDEQYASAHRAERMGPNELQNLIQRPGAWNVTRSILLASKLDRTKHADAVRQSLSVYELKNNDRLSARSIGVVNWSEDNVRYIRATKGFIAFKHKDDGQHGGELIAAMQTALAAWDPLPSRLMLTKFRAELNEGGLEVQDNALGDKEVGAIWYLRLLQEDSRNLSAIVNRTVRNHAEQLLDQLLPELSHFAKRIHEVDHVTGGDQHEVVKKRFKTNLKEAKSLEKARLGHNAFVGSKPAQAAHLELGHILKIGDDYWVCVTPACDMVPGRNRGTPPDAVKGIKRFTALKLVYLQTKTALKNVNQGGHIFANITNGSLQAKHMAFTVAREFGESPTWMVMYVENDGHFSGPERVLSCRVNFAKPSDGAAENSSPQIDRADAEICGMLRYEYALEVQSRFIASQSRIGLDFESSGDGQGGLAD